MAEGWAKALLPGSVEAFSAGTRPSGVNQLAIQVMREAGVDISTHASKSLEPFLGERFDYVVTLCGDAHEECPYFPGAGKVIHRGFPDPAAATGGEEEILAEFRRVRDLIREFVNEIPESLEEERRHE
jgi:arsenate reductase